MRLALISRVFGNEVSISNLLTFGTYIHERVRHVNTVKQALTVIA